jgi:mycothiol synthase
VLVARTSADPAHEMYYDSGVHPGYRQRGIGTALLDWAETAAVPIHDERFPGRELSLSGSCLASNSQAVALFGAHGYQAARWFHAMERRLAAEIPAASDLAEVSIVGFTPDRSDDTRLIRNEAFRDHWGSREMTAAGWAHFLALSVFRPEFSYLAYADDEPLAMILCHEYDAFDDAIGQRDLNVAVVGTRIVGRNRGVATSLLVRALTDAKAAGYTTASLVVDADSLTGAVGLYERVGFAVQHTTITQTKSLAD